MVVRWSVKLKWYYISILIVFRYLMPYYFDNILESYPLVANVVAIIPLIIGCFIILDGKISIKMGMFPFILLYFFYIISTIKNGGDVGSVFVHSLHVLMLCMVVDKLSYDNKKIEAFLRAVRDVTLFFFLINFIFTLIYPQGIPSITTDYRYPYFLYGNVNSTIRYIFPGICCSCLLDKERGVKFSLITLIFFAGVIENALRIYMTATAVVAILFIIFWIAFQDLLVGKERWVYLIIILIIAFFEITVVLNQGKIPLISVITGFFNKSSDFTGRFWLWKRSINMIKNSLVFGYGFKEREYLKMVIGNSSGSHNYFLDIAFQRGIIGESIFIAILVAPFFLLKGKKVSGTQHVLLGCCCACYLMFLLEPFYTTEYLIIPVIFILFDKVSNSGQLTVR